MNNNLKTGVVAGFVALVVLVGGLYLAPKTEVTDTAIETAVKQAIKNLGAFPGTEISGDSFKVNGLREVSVRTELQQGTSTICAIPSPVGSSTPIYFGVQLDSGYGTTTAGSNGPVVDLFISAEDRATTTAFASSTTNLIGSPYRPNAVSGATILAVNGATTTGSLVGTLTLIGTTTSATTSFGPQDLNGGSRHDFLVAKISNSASGDYREYAPVGGCYAKFLVHDSN